MLQDLNEISDGKMYGLKEMVRTAPADCAGCHACCEGMGDSIVLDPLDHYRLMRETGLDFEGLLKEAIELSVKDGLILPHLKMAERGDKCTFLNEEGRCSIHASRPGLCRTFPLGRIYEEQGVLYFRQKNACRWDTDQGHVQEENPGKAAAGPKTAFGNAGIRKEPCPKVKVGKWLDTPELKKYQQFLVKWHSFRNSTEAYLSRQTDENMQKTIHMFVLQLFYVKPYDLEADFYSQFEERMRQAAEGLSAI